MNFVINLYLILIISIERLMWWVVREISWAPTLRAVPVANMAPYAISSSLILVIHDNMINGTNHIVYHVFVDIYSSQGCKNITCQIEKIVYFSRVKNDKGKKKKRHRRTNRQYPRSKHRCTWTCVAQDPRLR
jgi:hypothetical protein